MLTCEWVVSRMWQLRTCVRQLHTNDDYKHIIKAHDNDKHTHGHSRMMKLGRVSVKGAETSS
jgi:hypothetical protein